MGRAWNKVGVCARNGGWVGGLGMGRVRNGGKVGG